MFFLHQMLCKSIFARALFIYLLLAVLLSSCSAPKKTIDPYQGRMERQKALIGEKYQGPESSAVPGSKIIRSVRPASVPGQPQLDDGVVPSSPDVLMEILTRINDRIFTYEEKKKQWGGLESSLSAMNLDPAQVSKINNCGWQLENILSKYNEFHERLLDKKSVRMVELLGGDSLLDIQYLDIDYLEGECTGFSAMDKKSAAAVMTGKQPASLRDAEKRINDAFFKKDYPQLIEIFETLPGKQKELASYEAVMQYAQALIKSERQDEALDLLENQLEKYNSQYNAKKDFALMQLVSDLRFALGNYDSARIQYEQLGDIHVALSDTVAWAGQQLEVLDGKGQQEEVDSYAALLLAHLGYNTKRDGFKVMMQAQEYLDKYPYSLVASSVDTLLVKSKELAEKWFTSILSEIDLLSFEEKFQEASLMIERMPKDILTPEKLDILQAKDEELITAEAIIIEQERLRKAQVLPKKWNKAMEHLEAKEYDNAIAVFRELLDTTYAEKARDQIISTIQLAVREGRRRAAELFVRANRTQDIDSRKKLLVASRKLLLDLLNKYPESDLIEKVKRNLSRIEDEITAVDPDLLLSNLDPDEVFKNDIGVAKDVSSEVLQQDEMTGAKDGAASKVNAE